MKYKLSYIEGAVPDYDSDMLLELVSEAARISIFKYEKKIVETIENIDMINDSFEHLFDRAVAAAISKYSKHVEDLDFQEIMDHVKGEIAFELDYRKDRCHAYMKAYGLKGNDLAERICYPKEHVDRRIVDFKHRISGNISIIEKKDGNLHPIQFISGKPMLFDISEEDRVYLMMNALLTDEEFGVQTKISVAYYPRLKDYRYILVKDDNKDKVKSLVSSIVGSDEFHRDTEKCHRCEFKNVCEGQ